MINMRRSRLWICLGLSLIIGLAAVGSASAGLLSIFKSRSKSATVVQRQSLVVFPFDKGSVTNLPDTFGQDMALSLKSMLSSETPYVSFLYSERLAPIKRASDENSLKSDDTKAPFTEDKTKPKKLAQVLGCDLYVVGEVQDYQFDQTKKVAQMTLSADLFDVKSGKLIKTVLVTGVTPSSTKATDEDELRALAAGDAVSKLKADILKTAEPAKETKTADTTVVEGKPAK